jgi:hypothetical protein
MEKALYNWLEGRTRKKAGQIALMVRERARRLYEYFVSCSGEVGDTKAFQASKGWFERLRKRSSHRKLKFEGETSSSEDESAASFPGVLKKLIEEYGYLPEQVFIAD